MTRDIRYAEARALQGHRAGFASRIVADAVDLGVIWLLGLSALLGGGVVKYLLTGPPFSLPVLPNWLDAGTGGAIAVVYLGLSWATTGRSVGKQVAGLRVVGRDGRRMTLWRSFARATLYVLFPAGLLWILASRRNASVQDLVLGTAVLYDWAYHPAEAGTSRALGEGVEQDPVGTAARAQVDQVVEDAGGEDAGHDGEVPARLEQGGDSHAGQRQGGRADGQGGGHWGPGPRVDAAEGAADRGGPGPVPSGAVQDPGVPQQHRQEDVQESDHQRQGDDGDQPLAAQRADQIGHGRRRGGQLRL
jgi:uncharacterized RDD family membrane protein YckC